VTRSTASQAQRDLPATLPAVGPQQRSYSPTTFSIQPLHFLFLAALQAGGSVAEALSDVAARHSRPLDIVARSWAREVRRPWMDTSFFIERATSGRALHLPIAM
jgi:hypothetical protein